MNLALLRGLVSDVEAHRCRSLIDEAPRYKAYLAEANKLRDKFRRLIINGRFQDTDGASCDNPDISWSVFSSNDELALVATQSHLECAMGIFQIPGYAFSESGFIGEAEVSADADMARASLKRHALIVMVFKKCLSGLKQQKTKGAPLALKSTDISLSVIHFGPDFKGAVTQGPKTVKADQGFPKAERDVWTLKGSFNTKYGAFALEETVRKTAEDEMELSIELKSENPVPTAEVSFVIKLPSEKFAGREIDIDGVKATLPVDFKDLFISKARKCRLFALPCQDFKLTLCLSGENTLLVQDDRKYKIPSFAGRIAFKRGDDGNGPWSLKLRIKTSPYESKPLIPLLRNEHVLQG